MENRHLLQKALTERQEARETRRYCRPSENRQTDNANQPKTQNATAYIKMAKSLIERDAAAWVLAFGALDFRRSRSNSRRMPPRPGRYAHFPILYKRHTLLLLFPPDWGRLPAPPCASSWAERILLYAATWPIWEESRRVPPITFDRWGGDTTGWSELPDRAASFGLKINACDVWIFSHILSSPIPVKWGNGKAQTSKSPAK